MAGLLTSERGRSLRVKGPDTAKLGIGGPHFRSPCNKDHTILGSIFGPALFGNSFFDGDQERCPKSWEHVHSGGFPGEGHLPGIRLGEAGLRERWETDERPVYTRNLF